ncbi:LANO_0C02762g1_1 [Lachancea nothofagi CBS 11611]|uniref:LANO_0C02762g1_1 n=1 Tax=Lachancea nothofagi CBS 11611 TaxID=1266666 RepID=A0A1G4J520_9SACH|nr:LANO_0C02762g1_1 [Lachancea nothofagi CBS 11611]
MSPSNTIACEDPLYLGASWKGLKRPERSNSMQSWNDSSTQRSLWTLELLEQEPIHIRPAVAPPMAPPVTSYSAPSSRPTFVKANSYSEGGHDFDEMSHYLSSNQISTQQNSHVHHHVPYNQQHHPPKHNSSYQSHPYLLQRASVPQDPEYSRFSHSAHATSAANNENYACAHQFPDQYNRDCEHDHESREDLTISEYHNESHQFTTFDSSAYVPWQVTPTSSLSDIPRVDYFDDFQAPVSLNSDGRLQSSGFDSSPPQAPSTSNSAYFPDVIATEPEAESESEFLTNTSSEDLHDRFYQSFNNPVQRSPTSRHESVYQQLIDDKPLTEALLKRVKRGYYRCAHCPKMFSSVLDYAKHIDEFEIQRDYKCPFVLCPWKILGLPRRPELRRHCAIQHKMEIPRELKSSLKLGESDFPIMECPSPYCDKNFFRRDSYARHVAMVHEKTDSRFNKRLQKVLEECPHIVGTEEHQAYVLTEIMKTKKKLKA